MKLTKKKAIELSIEKWEYIIKRNGQYEIPDSCVGLINGCGLCEYYNLQCQTCVLSIKKNNGRIHGCDSIEHVYGQWRRNNTTENAQKVLDLIKSIKV